MMWGSFLFNDARPLYIQMPDNAVMQCCACCRFRLVLGL